MGKYTYIYAFVTIFVPLVDLGLDHILIREVTRNKEFSREYIGSTLTLKLLIALFTLPLGMGITLLVGGSQEEIWAILLAFIGTLLFREIPTVVGYAVFLAYERMEFRVIATTLYQIIKAVATVIVVLMGGGLVPIFGALLLAEAGQGLLALRIVYRKFIRPRLTFDRKTWRFFVKESLPIGIAFTFHSYYFQIDVLILKYFRSTEETGLFGVPFRVITTLFTVLIPMIWVLLPHLTRAAKESFQKLHEDGQGYLKAIAVITMGITAYLMLEARELTVSIFGAEYEPSAAVLAVISPVIIFHALLYFFDLSFTAIGRQKLVVVGSGIIFTVKLIADLIFVPVYGIMGAAVGTLAADVACFAVMYALACKYVASFDFGRIMIKPVSAVICAAIVLWLIRDLPYYYTFVLFGLTYLFFIWLFRVVSEDQRAFMKQTLRGWGKRAGVLSSQSVRDEDVR
jgi:O-antigen/teichoic acid export membrane protein